MKLDLLKDMPKQFLHSNEERGMSESIHALLLIIMHEAHKALATRLPAIQALGQWPLR